MEIMYRLLKMSGPYELPYFTLTLNPALPMGYKYDFQYQPEESNNGNTLIR